MKNKEEVMSNVFQPAVAVPRKPYISTSVKVSKKKSSVALMSAELYQLQKLRFEQKLKELADAYMSN